MNILVKVWNLITWIVGAWALLSLLMPIVGISWLAIGQFVLVMLALFGAPWLMKKYFIARYGKESWPDSELYDRGGEEG